VIGAPTTAFIAEFLHRIEQGADVGPLHIPARPGLREVGLAVIMLTILILRPRGLTNGRELRWPRLPRRRSRGMRGSRPAQGGDAAESYADVSLQDPS
jgi:branched-chain amino acid transport system permease protein